MLVTFAGAPRIDLDTSVILTVSAPAAAGAAANVYFSADDVADDEKLTFEDYSEIFNYLSKNDGNLYGSIANSTDSKII